MISFRIDPDLTALVRADGIARQTVAVEYDGDQPTGATADVMLYRDGGVVRSVALADWPAEEAALTQRDTEAAALRNQVRTLAQSAVGVRIDQLTAAQVRALIAILLHQAGALTPDGAIRPIGEWT